MASEELKPCRETAFKACPDTNCDWGSFWRGWKACHADRAQDIGAMRQRAEKAEELLMLLRGMIGCTKENDALQMGTWISTHHPVIERIDAALAQQA